MFKHFIKSGLFGLTLVTCSTQALAAQFNVAQKTEIEQIVQDYVVNNPEIIVQAMQKLEEKQLEIHNKNVSIFGNKLREDKDTPALGTAKRKNYVVEFFDFNCGYCKIMEPLFKRLAEDKELDCQILFVNYPLLAQSSVKAATVALAIHQIEPEKYFEFHKILMSEQVDIEDLTGLEKIAKERLNLDWDKVMDIVKSKGPQEKLTENLVMGKALNITGTPYLIINGQEYRGAIQDYEVIKNKLKESGSQK